MTPACALCAVGAAFLYRMLTQRFARPRLALAALLSVLALITLGLMGIAGQPGLVRAGWLAVLLLFVLARVFAEGARIKQKKDAEQAETLRHKK